MRILLFQQPDATSFYRGIAVSRHRRSVGPMCQARRRIAQRKTLLSARMAKHGLVWVPLVLLLGLACDKSASHAVAAASFPTACEQSGECAAIFEGELTCCGATSGC